MNTPKNQSFTDSDRSSPMQIERIVAEIQVSSIFQTFQLFEKIKDLSTNDSKRFEVRYKFTDESEMTVETSDLSTVQLPGKEFNSNHVAYDSIKNFSRASDSAQVREFQNHLQYAKFLHWLNNMPGPAEIIEVEISE